MGAAVNFVFIWSFGIRILSSVIDSGPFFVFVFVSLRRVEGRLCVCAVMTVGFLVDHGRFKVSTAF